MPATATVCHCARCRVADAGLGPGPYTPAQYAKIAPTTVAPSRDEGADGDPAVKAAQLAVREAWEAFEPLQAAWLEAADAHRRAEAAPNQTVSDGRGGVFSLGGRRRLAKVGELARKRTDAREEMELAWKDVVKANDRLREATTAARIRAVEAARG